MSSVLCAKVEVKRFFDSDHRNAMEVRKRLMEISDEVKRCTNRLYQEWFLHHVREKTTTAGIEKWLKSNDKKDFPQAYSRELGDRLYKTLSDEFNTTLPAYMVACICNTHQQLIKKRKSARGSKRGWLAVLQGHESIPSFTRPLPIPVAKQLCDAQQQRTTGIAIQCDDEGEYTCRARLSRIKEGELEAVSFSLVAKRSARAKLERIESGVWKFKNASLFFDRGKRKWFLSIAYEIPTGTDAEVGDGKAIVFPGRVAPYRIFRNGKTYPFGGRGVEVEGARRRCERLRYSHQETYRRAPTANRKGHGRQRAIKSSERYSRQWNGFVKNWCRQFANNLAKHCVSSRIGHVIIYDVESDKFFLNSVGRHERSRSSWQWYMLRQLCERRLAKDGIRCEFAKKLKREKVKKGGARKHVKMFAAAKELG